MRTVRVRIPVEAHRDKENVVDAEEKQASYAALFFTVMFILILVLDILY